MHEILQEHMESHCMNCHRERKEEPIRSQFEGSNHYVTWECASCGRRQYWKTKHQSSGVHHLFL